VLLWCVEKNVSELIVCCVIFICCYGVFICSCGIFVWCIYMLLWCIVYFMALCDVLPYSCVTCVENLLEIIVC
jgi:hypothetical protein